MTDHVFKIKEVQRDGYIAYDAIEQGSKATVELGPQIRAGEYPEIEKHLEHVLQGGPKPLVFSPELGDEFDHKTQCWTFRRGPHVVVVHDMPRTLIRLTFSRS